MTSTLDDSGLTRDAFLGGRVEVWQPASGYRAGVDPVLLAASVQAVAGQSVLELGCGVGVASLCLGARVPGLALSGVEVQADYAALARRNAAMNGVAFDVIEGDLTALPVALRTRSFDHVLMNPPYFDRGRGTSAADQGRDIALGGETPLAAWADAAMRRLRPGGTLTLILSIARLPDMLRSLDDRLGSIVILPLSARADRAPTRFLCRARKGGRAPFSLLAPRVMHAADRHLRDGEDYTPAMTAVLRDGAALDWRD